MANRSPWLALKLTVARPLAALVTEKGGGSTEVHQWQNLTAKLANQVDDEVMLQRSEVCGEVALVGRTRGEDDGNECGSRQQWIWHPFYWLRGG
jgi:hypothetical protein